MKHIDRPTQPTTEQTTRQRTAPTPALERGSVAQVDDLLRSAGISAEEIFSGMHEDCPLCGIQARHGVGEAPGRFEARSARGRTLNAA